MSTKTSSEKTWLADLIEDVLQRKIDTILTDGITGRSMPHPVRALVDINNSYFRKLRDLGRATLDDLPAEAKDSNNWLKGSSTAMKWLLDRATEALKDKSLQGTDRVLVRRILSTCVTLLPIVVSLERDYRVAFTGAIDKEAAPLPAFAMARKDRLALSKAWELGSDTIAMQTVCMLDGDIITRVTAEYADDAHSIVRQIHREAVDISLQTWELLARSIGSFAEALFGRRS